jgi:type IV secretion system protein VirD4
VYGKRGDNRNLHTVHEFLSHPQKRDMAVKLMCESNCWSGTLAMLGGQLLSFNDKERSSVLTTVARHMAFLGTPAIIESTGTSSFDPAELRKGKMTIYLILPPSHQEMQAGLLRLWISALLRSVMSGGIQE